jgi:mannosyl-3-phosphoglycerate phosphatase
LKNPVIFTDLDGTLLDQDTYSFEKALPALELLKEKNIPLILCSSKTRREIEHYRKKLCNSHPFISENGGGIFLPNGYFKFQITDYKLQTEKDYVLIRLGAEYAQLRKALKELRSEGFHVRGFGDMTVKDISEATKLSADEAEMAKERDFDEPFFFDGGEHTLPLLFDAIKAKGFHHTQGKFFHILGDSDKGRAVVILSDLYRKQYGDIESIGIGDSPNDIPMLEKVDIPVIVQKPDESYDPRITIPDLMKAGGPGPDGWNMAVLKLLA